MEQVIFLVQLYHLVEKQMAVDVSANQVLMNSEKTGYSVLQSYPKGVGKCYSRSYLNAFYNFHLLISQVAELYWYNFLHRDFTKVTKITGKLHPVLIHDTNIVYPC